MSFANHFLAQVAVYTIVIFGVMYWSGTAIEPTVYDRYRASFEGMILTSANVDRTAQFYHRILDFKPTQPSFGDPPMATVALRAPDGGRVFFVQKLPEAPSGSSATLLVRVRNGLRGLHKSITARMHAPVLDPTVRGIFTTVDTEHASSIITQPWGKEFVVADPDGNQVIFFQPSRKTRTRF